MAGSRFVELLQKALQRLPGIGPRGAQRMVFHLLANDRDGARAIAETLQQALADVVHCRRCNNFSESELCVICASPARDQKRMCVVETPADLQTVEQAGVYDGLYFVLMGRLSPLDGVGPEQLQFERLAGLCKGEELEEVILATNQTAEGEATADYISDLAAPLKLRVTRLARGLPVGAELEYTDAGTLARAFSERRAFQEPESEPEPGPSS